MTATNWEDIRFAILAVDVAVIAVIDRAPHVLLIPVQLPEIVHTRGLPGGLVRPRETAEDAVARLLAEKCDLRGVYCEQLATFSGIERDPRGRVVSVAYLALVPEALARDHKLPAGLAWCPTAELGEIAYDHNEIVEAAIERLRGKLQYTTIARHLLPARFTLSELQSIYESVLGRDLDKRNFRKKLISIKVVRRTGKKQRSAVGPPSELYRFAGSTVRLIDILS